jgi:L-asparaginase II
MAIFVVGLDTERYGPIGVAVKLEDGNMAPMPIVVMKVLQEIGVLSEEDLDRLASFRTMRLSNWRGMDIGEVATNFQLH